MTITATGVMTAAGTTKGAADSGLSESNIIRLKECHPPDDRAVRGMFFFFFYNRIMAPRGVPCPSEYRRGNGKTPLPD